MENHIRSDFFIGIGECMFRVCFVYVVASSASSGWLEGKAKTPARK